MAGPAAVEKPGAPGLAAVLEIDPYEDVKPPPHQRAGLRYLGDWLARFGAAVYGTRPWRRSTARTTDGRSVWFTNSGVDVFITIEGTGGGPVEFDGVRLDPGHEVMCLEPKTAVRPSDGARGTVVNLPPGPSTSPVTVLRVVEIAIRDA